MEKFILLVDSHHGIYMAQSAIEVLQRMDNVDYGDLTQDEIQILLDGPDNEEYAELSCEAMDAITVLIEGEKYGVSWNEDLWLVRDGLTEEEWEDFMI